MGEIDEIAKEVVQMLVNENSITRIQRSEIAIETEEIGEGGQAKVHLGYYDGKTVAVKELINIDWKSLSNEMVILSSLDHQFIPKLYGIVYEEEDGYFALIFQYIDGTVLNIFMQDMFPSDELKYNIIKSLADILQYMHDCNFIHRDLKPENIMIDKNFNTYLIDFGISKVITEKSYTMTRAKGTLSYLAPESLQLSKNDEDDVVAISTKVDVWAFGCLVSYIYTGKNPWTNKYQDSRPVIQKLLFLKKPYPIPEVNDPRVAEVMKIALQIEPQDRASMADIFKKLSDEELQ